MWTQKQIELAPQPRGIHLVTREIVTQLPELSKIRMGLLHLFLLHTSAALTINENSDPDVLHDMQLDFERLVPEKQPYYKHTVEGPDDMPAHTKAVLTGTGVTIPVRDGRLWLGTWQGVYLAEFRNRGGGRKIAATLQGEALSA